MKLFFPSLTLLAFSLFGCLQCDEYYVISLPQTNCAVLESLRGDIYEGSQSTTISIISYWCGTPVSTQDCCDKRVDFSSINIRCFIGETELAHTKKVEGDFEFSGPTELFKDSDNLKVKINFIADSSNQTLDLTMRKERACGFSVH